MRTINGYQETSSPHARTNCYTLFYFPSPREYIRVLLSVTIFRTSSYWDVLIAPPGSLTFLTTDHPEWLPRGLYNQVQTQISIIEISELEKTSRLNIYLSNEARPTGEHKSFRMSASLLKLLPSAKELSVLAFLYDLGCPRYVEKEIVHLGVISFPIYTVCLHGEIVTERKINDPGSAIFHNTELYNIKVLHCLNGSTGIPKFYGIVTSNCGQQLKSYLLERPENGTIRAIMIREQSNGQTVPWPRREKWARQIIQAVKNVHSKGFVVGILGMFISMPNSIRIGSL